MPNQTVSYFTELIKYSEKISDKEKAIIVKRLRGTTLEHIGKKYKLTAERIRQIENETLSKLAEKVYQLFLFDPTVLKKKLQKHKE